jgi:hypothetical protein
MQKYLWSYGVLSDDGLYRYALIRKWDLEKPALMFVMMNPSTADASKDDPTIRRCVGLAKELGYGSILVGNLFAWRSTDPKAVPHSMAEAVGPENDAWLELLALQAKDVVAAWGALVGTRGIRHTRIEQVESLIRPRHPVHAFELTNGGHPRHPLYMKRGTGLRPWLTQLTACDLTARKIAEDIERDMFEVHP